jgi:hypothetical protein
MRSRNERLTGPDHSAAARHCTVIGGFASEQDHQAILRQIWRVPATLSRRGDHDRRRRTTHIVSAIASAAIAR